MPGIEHILLGNIVPKSSSTNLIISSLALGIEKPQLFTTSCKKLISPRSYSLQYIVIFRFRVVRKKIASANSNLFYFRKSCVRSPAGSHNYGVLLCYTRLVLSPLKNLLLRQKLKWKYNWSIPLARVYMNKQKYFLKLINNFLLLYLVRVICKPFKVKLIRRRKFWF